MWRGEVEEKAKGQIILGLVEYGQEFGILFGAKEVMEDFSEDLE